MSRIAKLEITNIKGVRHVEIHAAPDAVEIAGQNGQGKSSVLDSILFALGGKRAIETMPVRSGQEKGEVTVALDDGLVVRRHFGRGGETTTLTVTAADKGKHGQQKLDGLFDSMTFDPLAFARATGAQQLQMLRAVAGPDVCAELDRLDVAIADLAEQRLEVGREIKRLGDPVMVPEAEYVDIDALTARLSEAQSHNAAQDRLDAGRRAATTKIADAERAVAQARATLADAEANLERLQRAARSMPAAAERMNVEAIMAELRGARAVNEAAARYDAYRIHSAARQDAERLRQELNERIEGLREECAAAGSRIDLGVPGMVIGPDGLTVEGVPFAQAASSERIMLSAAVAMGIHRELRIMFVRDGSLLDSETFGRLVMLARERGYQLWIETVGDGHGDAIVLRAGEVVDAETNGGGMVEVADGSDQEASDGPE